MCYLFSCLHFEISLLLFVRVLDFSAFVMKSFCDRHRLQSFGPLSCGAAFVIIDHLMFVFWSLPLFFSFQTCFDNSVLFACFLFRNDSWCPLNLCLNVPSVSLM